jgi:hypothetical protein
VQLTVSKTTYIKISTTNNDSRAAGQKMREKYRNTGKKQKRGEK